MLEDLQFQNKKNIQDISPLVFFQSQKMPIIQLTGKGLGKIADPEEKYEIGKVSNNHGQSAYMVVEKNSKEPVCEKHWNNDLQTLNVYIGSLKSPTQSKCVGCGMLNKCNQNAE